MDCNEFIKSNPTSSKFMTEKLFGDPANFPNLEILY